MIEESIFEIINNVGFPIFIAIVLLYDKIKSNGSLKRAVENNNKILNNLLESVNDKKFK